MIGIKHDQIIAKISSEYLMSEMQLFENDISSILQEVHNKITDSKSKIFHQGKRIRPMLFILMCKMLHFQSDKRTIDYAAAIELMHIASMVHDDVLDSSSTRHGISSINASCDNKIAVLCGDAIMSKSLLLASKHNEIDVTIALIDAASTLIDGELAQAKYSGTMNITLNDYMKIIRQKTATLFIAASKITANITQCSEGQMLILTEIATNIGLIVQIKDDIIDYWDYKGDSGKPKMNDITEKKITLPLICALKQMDKGQYQYIKSIITSKNPISTGEIESIYQMISMTESYNQCIAIMDEHVRLIYQLLDQFANNRYMMAIKLLVEYIKHVPR